MSKKLHEKQVQEILMTCGPYQPIADAFGVSISTISKIKNRKVWKHVRLDPPR